MVVASPVGRLAGVWAESVLEVPSGASNIACLYGVEMSWLFVAIALVFAAACSSAPRDVSDAEQGSATVVSTTAAVVSMTAAVVSTTAAVASTTTVTPTTAFVSDQATTSAPSSAGDQAEESEPVVSYMPPTEPGEDTTLCELKDLWRGPNDPVRVGFPRPTENVSPEGTTKYALVPIDFPDAVGEPWEIREAAQAAETAVDYYREVSDGRFEVEWVLSDVFTRVSKASVDYDPSVGNPGGSKNPFGVALSQEIIDLVDPHLDFTGVAAIFFYLPEATPDDAVINRGGWGHFMLEGAFSTDEGKVMFAHGAPSTKATRYNHGWLLAHEIGHTLGPLDLYVSPATGDNLSSLPMGDWGVMSSYHGPPKSMTAWNRWLIGWLEPESIYCRTAASISSVEFTLRPLVLTGAGYRAAMIRIDDHTAAVVESRRGLGVDWRLGDDAGILVYTVDTSVGQHQGPLHLQLPKDRSLQRTHEGWPDALLRVGDSVTVAGLTIELVQSGEYDRVRISQ